MTSFHSTTFNQGFYEPDDNHKVWYAQSGNPEGIPVLMFHGGPGAQSKPKHLRLFDITDVQVLQFDQRGAGNSTAADLLKDNTAQHILEDAKALCDMLGFKKVVVAGGSWGSTMALLFAQQYPQFVSHIVLRGVFLANKKSTNWINNGEAKLLYPDLWDRILKYLKEFHLQSIDAKVLFEKLHNGSEAEQQLVCKIMREWEGNLLGLDSSLAISQLSDMSEEERTMWLIFLHYELHEFFIEENQILNNVDAIKHIPTAITHGRYDAVCPAWQALPTSMLEITQDSGHQLSTTSEKVSQQMVKNLLRQ
jgi:proline iminopeptidase